MDEDDISELADLSELSKEQILERLAPRIARSRGDTSFDGKCKFLPSKGPQVPCPLPAATPWGFCSKHSRTAQGRGAQISWRESAKTSAPRKAEKVEEEEEESPAPKKRVIKISRNKYGRYCDPDTGLCFDGITKAVIGYQEPNGEFRSRLTTKEKTYCREHGLKIQESKPAAFAEESSFVKRPPPKERVAAPVRRPSPPEEEEEERSTRSRGGVRFPPPAYSGAGRGEDDYSYGRPSYSRGGGAAAPMKKQSILKKPKAAESDEEDDDGVPLYDDE